MPGQAPPTVLCLQDLSCVGRSSLSVVLPALAAMGVQPCALPTALLSTHTGGFGAPARTDESAFLTEALAHLERLALPFDCVYSGYLAGARQAALVARAFRQNPAALRVVDPAMADHGRLYASVTPELRGALARLCGQADVIVPNATEAALLLDENPEAAADGRHAAAHAPLLLRRFPRLRCAVVTGAAGALPAPPDAAIKGSAPRPDAGAGETPAPGNVCAVRGEGGTAVFLPYEAAPQAYPGTGDLFAAVLAGGLVRGMGAVPAAGLAARFVSLAAARTHAAGADPRFGVRFEPLLGTLAEWTRQEAAQPS